VPTLFVKCKGCNSEFPTPIGEPKSDETEVIISNLKLRCAKCGHEAEYSTADFHIPANAGGPPAGGGEVAVEDLTTEHNAKEMSSQQKLAGYGVVPPEGRPARGE
jgi:hypothetical protein